MADLQGKLSELGEELKVPGVSVGIISNGEEEYAFHGVTSVENPLEVDEHTLFQFGSTGKTFTATAIMRLVDQGSVSLDEKVKTYVPELQLKDKDAENNVTVLQLLNHTAGWQGDVMTNTGDGDDAVARYVEEMVKIEQVTPLGATMSYNNAALALAGHLIAKVTGKVYEQAMKELIFVPLGLENTFFFPNDVMTRRFACGHNMKDDGTIEVARPWWIPRSMAPAGGMSATAADQMIWARFHLGDGMNAKGERVLSKELLDLMKEPTFEMRGSALGDAVGISWLLRDVDGVRLVSHGGTTNGQHSAFSLCPERNFGLAIMSNCGPNGPQLNGKLAEWLMETYLGITVPEDEPIKLADEALADYVGTYRTVGVSIHVTIADGGLSAKSEVDPEMWKQISESKEIPDQPPVPLGMLAGEGDRFIVSDGPGKGMRGYFPRDASRKVSGLHFGGRLAERVS